MPTRKHPSGSSSSARLRRPLILVVDDIVDNREMYVEYLRFAGFRVEGVADGEAAIEAAHRLQPSVVLMDLSLPGIDGCEATRILKGDPKTSHILIIAVTGRTEPARREQAALAGCDLFIPKPSLPSEIAKTIIHLLDATATASGVTKA